MLTPPLSNKKRSQCGPGKISGTYDQAPLAEIEQNGMYTLLAVSGATQSIATTCCIADRPEVDAKFRWWRDAQLNDRYLIKGDPHREAILAASELQKSDPKAALSEFLALAEGGSVWSMLHVGTIYGRKTNGTQNLVEAERWLGLAAERGSRRARLYLANVYAMQLDIDACEEVLQSCVAEGLAPAMYILGMAKLQQRPKTATRWEDARTLLEQASTLGDLGAQWALSRRMVQGWFGWRRIPRGFQLMVDASKKTEALMGESHETPYEATADTI